MEQAINDKKPKLSNREVSGRRQELLSELLAGCSTEGDLFGPEGVFTKLKAELMERLLDAEMTEHLGHEPHARRHGHNARNGYSRKTVTTDSGPVQIQVPRDRRAPSSRSWSRRASADSMGSMKRCSPCMREE